MRNDLVSEYAYIYIRSWLSLRFSEIKTQNKRWPKKKQQKTVQPFRSSTFSDPMAHFINTAAAISGKIKSTRTGLSDNKVKKVLKYLRQWNRGFQFSISNSKLSNFLQKTWVIIWSLTATTLRKQLIVKAFWQNLKRKFFPCEQKIQKGT